MNCNHSLTAPLGATLAAGLLLMALPGISTAAVAPDPRDPWEGYNRAIYSFNDTLDGVILKPMATMYETTFPEPVDQGITNFFSNLGEPLNFLNSMLQGKPGSGFNALARFTVNSTIGLLGVIDVATNLGIEKSSEDFGQTLAVWGVNPGPYFVLPFLGPSTVRDTFGMPFDFAANPFRWTAEPYIMHGLEVVDTRADLLEIEEGVEGITTDEYVLMREAYLDWREYQINYDAADVDAYADVYDY